MEACHILEDIDMTTEQSGAAPSNSLEDRIRRLEDIEEIRRLKVRYFEACDGGFGGLASHIPEEIADTFAVDGEWDGGPFGKRVGRQAIREFYDDVPQFFAYTMLSEPVIDVDGDRAIGRWNLMVYSDRGGVSRVTGGTHHDEYVRTPEGWRIALSRFEGAVNLVSELPWNAARSSPKSIADLLVRPVDPPDGT